MFYKGEAQCLEAYNQAAEVADTMFCEVKDSQVKPRKKETII